MTLRLFLLLAICLGARSSELYTDIFSTQGYVCCPNSRPLLTLQTWLMFVPAFYSFFCGGVMGTYLSLHFSVRSRALSSFLYREWT